MEFDDKDLDFKRFYFSDSDKMHVGISNNKAIFIVL